MKEFVEEDQKFVNELGKLEKDQKYFSMNIVSKENPPVYPIHCDVLDTWCYSYYTPHCPKDLRKKF
jgi:hypothetical protein